jgi:hypothetical protein
MQEALRVTRVTVEQRVRREFPAEQFEEVMSALDEIEKSTEEARVDSQLKILNLSNGKLALVRKNIDAFFKNYVGQPVPKVTQKHVERIIRREFPAEYFSEIMTALHECLQGSDEQLRSRVQLAVLKLAGGKMNAFEDAIKSAKSDWRDVISWAEYPEWSKRWDTFKLPLETKKEIVSKDWQQYKDWFDKK